MIFDEERVGDFVPLRKGRDALQARVEKLERVCDAHKSAAAYWAAESKRIKEWADTSIESVAEAGATQSSALQARVEVLTAALKKVTDYFASAPALMSTGQWEALSDARAVLAAGETESEA